MSYIIIKGLNEHQVSNIASVVPCVSEDLTSVCIPESTYDILVKALPGIGEFSYFKVGKVYTAVRHESAECDMFIIPISYDSEESAVLGIEAMYDEKADKGVDGTYECGDDFWTIKELIIY